MQNLKTLQTCLRKNKQYYIKNILFEYRRKWVFRLIYMYAHLRALGSKKNVS